MKLKNIFIIVFATLLGFTACVDETLVSESTKVTPGLPTSLNITVDTESIQTKAAAGYTYATSDEILIHNLAVAVFEVKTVGSVDVVTDKRVGFAYMTYADGETTLTHEEDGATRAMYEVKNIPAITGKVKVMVLANSTYSKTELEDVTSYAAFSTLSEENVNELGNYVFDPSKLVKFGEVTTTLGTTNSPLHIRLTQLAAKINLSFEVNVPDTEVIVEEEYQYSYADIKEMIINKNPGKQNPNDPNQLYYECDYSHAHPVDGKWLVFNKNIKTTTTTTNGWSYALEKVVIKNINPVSNAFLGTYASSGYTYNTLVPEDGYGTYLIEISEDNIATVVFYTYEKAYQTPDPIIVDVVGDLRNAKIQKVEKQAFAMEYRWESSTSQGGGWGKDGTITDKTEKAIGELELVSNDVVETYYSEEKQYQLVFDPVENKPLCNTNGVVHGNQYNIKGLIDTHSQRVDFSISVTPWDNVTVPIGAIIKEIHFLVVKETEIVMPNVATYNIEYRSDTPIRIINKEATHTTYGKKSSTDNTIVADTIDCVGDQIPDYTIIGNTIVVKSKIPANNVPKFISFTVENEDGLTEDVVITQYPAHYFTHEVSVGGGPMLSGDSGNDADGRRANPNLFIINIIDADTLKVGVVTGPDGQTLSSPEANNMVSPRFMLASRQAVVSTPRYTSNMAIERCKTYWEETEDGTIYPAGTWRAPTLAELEFMNQLQDKSPFINALFVPTGNYWSALPAWYYNFSTNKRVDHGNANTTLGSGGGARCVRDIY
ncbi:hypothetical protein LJC57_06465 [Parabacteroides sp. OttesenSCG-928-G07]|nr:hypothetical protein [Parabacteroides sp. OttesenSCG-928-G07]